MNIVTMDALMAQTNALPEEGALLEIYAEAAEKQVLDDTRCTLAELQTKGGGQVPADVVLAVLLLVGHWYKNREATSSVSMYTIPMGYAALIKKYRQFKTDWRS